MFMRKMELDAEAGLAWEHTPFKDSSTGQYDALLGSELAFNDPFSQLSRTWIDDPFPWSSFDQQAQYPTPSSSPMTGLFPSTQGSALPPSLVDYDGLLLPTGQQYADPVMLGDSGQAVLSSLLEPWNFLQIPPSARRVDDSAPQEAPQPIDFNSDDLECLLRSITPQNEPEHQVLRATTTWYPPLCVTPPPRSGSNWLESAPPPRKSNSHSTPCSTPHQPQFPPTPQSPTKYRSLKTRRNTNLSELILVDPLSTGANGAALTIDSAASRKTTAKRVFERPAYPLAVSPAIFQQPSLSLHALDPGNPGGLNGLVREGSRGDDLTSGVEGLATPLQNHFLPSSLQTPTACSPPGTGRRMVRCTDDSKMNGTPSPSRRPERRSRTMAQVAGHSSQDCVAGDLCPSSPGGKYGPETLPSTPSSPPKAPTKTLPKRSLSMHVVGKKLSAGGGTGPVFVNFTARDKTKLLSGVAPSGSSKRKRLTVGVEVDESQRTKRRVLSSSS